MAIPIRHSNPQMVISGARTFFVTSSTWGKRNLLQSDRAAELFVKVLYEYRAQGKYRLHEFIVMLDHFHVLITVESSITVERAVQFIKGGFAFRAGKELGFRAPVWQKGFSETRVTEPVAYANVQDYIRENPVARRLVERAEDYEFSSARPGLDLDPPPQRLKPIELARLSARLKSCPDTNLP
jgi:putative transposase